jgi:SAM-dependent methyltransferase
MPDKQPTPAPADLPSMRLLREQAKWLAPARTWLLKQADLASRRSVLDLGCGFGIVTQELASQTSGRVVALDHNLAALRTAPAALRAAGPACGDATALPFAGGSFDLVFSQLALLWMPMAPTLAELRRVLQVGGVLIAIEPDYGGLIEYPAEIALKELWISGLERAGADPLVGRKLPGALASVGFDVRVELFSEMMPPASARFDLLRGLPLTSYEQHLLDKIEYQASRLAASWQQVAHLPFLLITAVKKEAGTDKQTGLARLLKKETRK